MSMSPTGPGHNNPQHQNYPPHSATPAPARPRRSDAFGITALTLGILSIVLVWVPGLGLILGIVAIIFGSIGLAKSHKVMSGIGLGLGTTSVLIFVIIIATYSGSGDRNEPTQPDSGLAAAGRAEDSLQQHTASGESATQPQQPTVVLGENHSGAESTSNFTVSGKYTFAYSYDCGNSNNFMLQINSADTQTMVAMPVNTIGVSGSDTLSKRAPTGTGGPFYVKSVIGGCDWSITITDLPG